jgi:hypothetical protein
MVKQIMIPRCKFISQLRYSINRGTVKSLLFVGTNFRVILQEKWKSTNLNENTRFDKTTKFHATNISDFAIVTKVGRQIQRRKFGYSR